MNLQRKEKQSVEDNGETESEREGRVVTDTGYISEAKINKCTEAVIFPHVSVDVGTASMIQTGV